MLVIVKTPQSDLWSDIGESRLYFGGSAGANRGRVELEITGLPAGWQLAQLLPGTLKMRAADKTCMAEYIPEPSQSLVVIVMHKAAAGTWHGAGILAPSAERLPGEGHTHMAPHPGERWLAWSGSGGGDIVAGIWVLGEQPLEIRTSGYDGRRWWMVVTVALDGSVKEQSVAEWRAQRQPEEIL